LTLDESWFYFSTARERIWLTPEQLVPDRERNMIQSPKLMPTVAWNPSGSQVLTALPRGLEFNAGYYVMAILERIKNWWKG
jgi:hypothetical protein